MLVLSRKQGEEIVIGGNIRVKVVEVGGNRVKLAFSAPVEVPIRRSELTPPISSDEFSIVLVGA
jgi:carbon storage regulator